MVTCISNVILGHYVAIDDIPGVFLQTDIVHSNLTVFVRLCGVLVDIIVKIDP